MQRDQAHRTNELLERIAIALEKSNKKETPKDIPLTVTNDIPGFEGTLKDLHDLKLHTDELSDKCLAANCDGDECTHNDYDDDIHNDYLIDLVKDMSKEQYMKFYLDMDFGFALSDTVSFNNHIYDLGYAEVLDCIKSARNILEPTSDNPDPAGYGDKCCDDDCPCNNEPASDFHKDFDEQAPLAKGKDPYGYSEINGALREFHCGVVNDSDFEIRKTAYSYDAAIDEDLHTKKDCILDYVTNEFGTFGARYTDIIKFAYYLGSPNAPKYTSENRGYYAMAFNTRFGGHLVQGGKDQLVKGINNEGDERYFALSFVESATAYWKRIE